MSNVNGQMSNVKGGFTLPELMIAISILVIISLIAVVSFRSFDSISKLRGARDEIMSNLLDMQSWARSGKLVNICQDANGNFDTTNYNGICDEDDDCNSTTGFTCELGFPPGGYGVHFDSSTDPDTYVLFANIFTSVGHEMYEAAEKLLGSESEKSLPSNMSFSDSQPSGPASFRNINASQYYTDYYPIDVIFQPDGTMKILSGPTYIQKTIQRISVFDNSKFSKIYINSISGLIYGDEDSRNPAGTGSP